MNSRYDSPNSFYNLGDIEILTFSQDEQSKLWKFYLSTDEHYVVSREFDRSKGMYANAPEETVRKGLMDFSASILGNQLSIFAVMDMFIDRCFSETAFDEFTTNAAWMSMVYPSYEEVESILSNYGNRIVWTNGKDDANNPLLAEYMYRMLYKTPNAGGERDKLIDGILSEFKRLKVSAIYLNEDRVMEDVLSDSKFDGIPIFKGEFVEKRGEDIFTSFKYIGH